jgi:hypothetical protein
VVLTENAFGRRCDLRLYRAGRVSRAAQSEKLHRVAGDHPVAFVGRDALIPKMRAE